MNNQEWAKDIKPFEWEELDGKTLQIRAGKHEGVMIVVGYDQETKDTFVLHEEFSTVPTIKPGDKVNYHDFQFPNLRAAIVDHLRVHSFGTYAVLKYDGELYTVPLSNVEVVE